MNRARYVHACARSKLFHLHARNGVGSDVKEDISLAVDCQVRNLIKEIKQSGGKSPASGNNDIRVD